MKEEAEATRDRAPRDRCRARRLLPAVRGQELGAQAARLLPGRQPLVSGRRRATARSTPSCSGACGPIVEGTLAEWIDFRIMPDFAGSSSSLQDAYANLRPFGPLAQLQVGKFKAPFGLERLQSATAITFIERGLPTNLVPNRDLGVQLWGDWNGGLLTYQLAVMNGVTDGSSADTDNNDGKDLVARVFAKPFQDTTIEPLQGLGVGVGDELGPRDRHAGELPHRRPADLLLVELAARQLDEDRLRISPQVYWYWGPFGLLGEYVLSKNTVSRTARGSDEDDADIEAWQITAS